jgi:hypothetical protein
MEVVSQRSKAEISPTGQVHATGLVEGQHTAGLHTGERRGLTGLTTQEGQALLPSAAGALTVDCPVQGFQCLPVDYVTKA